MCMPRRIFLAGATGVIGQRLVPLLVRAGYEVTGTTRSSERRDQLWAAGATPVLVDVFDAVALTRAIQEASPEVIIDQLTNLPHDLFRLDPQQREEALKANARVRVEGTQNLVAAAKASGVRRFIAQSIIWTYASGRQPHVEADPLDLAARGLPGITVQGAAALEDRVLTAGPDIEGLVLRYGWLYGPGTGHETAWNTPSLHVDAAAQAAFLAIESGAPGIYNVAETDPYASNEKAQRVLRWDPDFRL